MIGGGRGEHRNERTNRLRFCLGWASLAACACPAQADPPPPAAKAAAEQGARTPLPADRTILDHATIGSRVLSYRVTVGTIAVRDEEDKRIGEVVYTAYVVPGREGTRPITFAFNGGPGASSVYLNMGAIGPKRLQFGAQGDGPSDPPIARDNPNSWLDMTDLVFIDPIGTGYSRSLTDEATAKKAFFGGEQDVNYLSRVVYDWLVRNERLRSPKYVIGESYGGYRAPRIAYQLQSSTGVGLSGVILVSPALDLAASDDATALSPLPWMISLPSMAAANLERHGQLTAAAMRPVEDYARGDFVHDLLLGASDAAASARLVARVAELTGLDPALVRRLGGRIDMGTYLREVHRADATLGSAYDSNVTELDPFPWAPQQRLNDPLLDRIIAPTTSAMVDFVTREVGWKTEAHYNALSYKVGELWERGRPEDKPAADLRKALAADPKMRVLLVHGWNDLSCPFFASRLIVDQMAPTGLAANLRLAVYPGGHMFYNRPASSHAFHEDARAFLFSNGGAGDR